MNLAWAKSHLRVFDGLQRGFKKAGAQAIIMSLRSVKDKETAEFVTCFYRNLVHFPMQSI